MNSITDGAGEKLALILRKNNVLTDLNISNNLLKDDTGNRFVNILVHNITLQTHDELALQAIVCLCAQRRNSLQTTKAQGQPLKVIDQQIAEYESNAS